MISYIDGKYLKHAGDQMDVKVSIRQVGEDVAICIRDQEFFSFQSALMCLQRIANEEMPRQTMEVL